MDDIRVRCEEPNSRHLFMAFSSNVRISAGLSPLADPAALIVGGDKILLLKSVSPLEAGVAHG